MSKLILSVKISLTVSIVYLRLTMLQTYHGFVKLVGLRRSFVRQLRRNFAKALVFLAWS
jgi:hypothetical protein